VDYRPGREWLNRPGRMEPMLLVGDKVGLGFLLAGSHLEIQAIFPGLEAHPLYLEYEDNRALLTLPNFFLIGLPIRLACEFFIYNQN
jgi:hypothetical protein